MVCQLLIGYNANLSISLSHNHIQSLTCLNRSSPHYPNTTFGVTTHLFSFFYRQLVVVHFWAAWAPQCQQMNDVMTELAKDTKIKAKYAKVSNAINGLLFYNYI